MAVFQNKEHAVKSNIKNILEADLKGGEDLNNILVTKAGQKISRVNVMGYVISVQSEAHLSVVVDDGTGLIAARLDAPSLPRVASGDLAVMIGTPVEINDEKVLMLEIIKKLDDKRWFDVRKKELERESNKDMKNEKINKESPAQANERSRVLATIRDLDSGLGVDIDRVIRELNVGDAEKIIDNLLQEGELFEVRPGKLKILE